MAASCRALANQKLYLARILSRAWKEALADGQAQATVLADAFSEPAREHLRQAYGWFLLELAQPAQLPATPPGSIHALPDVAAGKALSGELREFRQLEEGGWLAELLAPAHAVPQTASTPGNLAANVNEGATPEHIEQMAAALQATFDRMSDSLNEY